MGEKEKKGYMVCTPVGAFKSPNDPDCPTCKVADEVARSACACFSPDVMGLKFLASVHGAHYATCSTCQTANPAPDPKPTPEDVAVVEEYAKGMEAIQNEPIGGVGLSMNQLREALAEMLGESQAHGCGSNCSCKGKKTIGFVN